MAEKKGTLSKDQKIDFVPKVTPNNLYYPIAFIKKMYKCYL